jgi:WD40 repeat protein
VAPGAVPAGAVSGGTEHLTRSWADPPPAAVLEGPVETLPDTQLAVPEPTPAVVPAPPPLPAVEGYEILGILGRGGMGVVYKARHTRLNRVVALKMILSGEHAGPRELARFRAEALAVAKLHHPNVVQIHEVGEQDGRPYFALEYVDGGSLFGKLADAPFPARQAARLIETLARAMHHAHQQGIVHRDLKPGNVLLAIDGDPTAGQPPAEPGANWVPKITDFGLARLLDDDSGPTRSGAVIGTPSYMAPEQASGEGKYAGPSADVYSLGAMLYELLTGRPPFKAATTLETLRQVIGEEPVPPARLNSRVPRDLETVCARALEKDTARRYASAEDFADDLRRFLAHEPIRARPVGRWERVAKWARRRPAAAALVAVSVALTLAVVGGGLWHYFDLQHLNTLLQAALQQATSDRAEAIHQEGIAVKARGVAEDRERDARRRWYVSDVNLAQQAWERAHVARMRQLLEPWQKPDPDREDPRSFEWYHFWRLCNGYQSLGAHADTVWAVAYSPDGKVLATSSQDRTVRLWVRDEKPRILQHTGPVSCLAFTPDSKGLAAGSHNGTVKIYDVETGTERRTLPRRGGAARTVAFAPDGQTLATGSDDGKIRFWAVAVGGAEPVTLPGHSGWVNGLCFAPDGQTLASGSYLQKGNQILGEVKLWDLNARMERASLVGHTDKVLAVAFSPDGNLLATASTDRTVRLWDPATGKERSVLQGHGGDVLAVAFSPDGKTVASGSADTTVKLWEAATGTELSTRKGHTNWVTAVAFSPDGKTLASGSIDKSVKLWDVAGGAERDPLRGHKLGACAAAFSPDGTVLATGSLDGTVRLWRAATGEELAVLEGHKDGASSVAFSPDGRTLAVASVDRTIHLWDVAARKERAVLKGHPSAVLCVAFSPDGQGLASAGDDGIRLWEGIATRAGEQYLQFKGARCVAFSPDGQVLAAAGSDRSVRLWNYATGQELRTLPGHQKEVRTVAFSPDGKTLASGSVDGTVRLWEVATGAELATLSGHRSAVRSIAFCHDGKTLAAGSREVKLWDLATHQERASFPGRGHQVDCVAFAPEGWRLAAGCYDGTVLLWDGGR